MWKKDNQREGKGERWNVAGRGDQKRAELLGRRVFVIRGKDKRLKDKDQGLSARKSA